MEPAKLPPVSEQMKAWSAALAGEVTDWPKVTGRSFFGFTALYRGDRIFGVLPRTRGWGTGNCLAFKIENPTSVLRARLEKDPRIGSMEMQKARWFTFEIAFDADLHEAMDWLAHAYGLQVRPRNQSSSPFLVI